MTVKFVLLFRREKINWAGILEQDVTVHRDVPFIVSLNTAVVSRRKPGSAGTSSDIFLARGRTVYIHVGLKCCNKEFCKLLRYYGKIRGDTVN